MSDFYSRTLSSKDIPFIMAEFDAGAIAGNYSNEFRDAKLSKIIEGQIRNMISAEENGRHSGHYFFILTRHSNKERIGYIWFLPSVDPYGAPCLELRAIGVSKKFRGKGYASMMLSDWIDTNDNLPFVAKCLIKSTQMIKMLKNRGFNLFSTSQTGTQLLVRYPKNILSP